MKVVNPGPLGPSDGPAESGTQPLIPALGLVNLKDQEKKRKPTIPTWQVQLKFLRKHRKIRVFLSGGWDVMGRWRKFFRFL
jgi:hypothetical protein